MDIDFRDDGIMQVSEAETAAVRGELKTALKRVEDLQAAISGEIDSDNSDAVSVV